MSEGHKKIQENQQSIKTTAEVLLLTVTQNIAQRGHWESKQSKNKENVLELLQLLAKHNLLIKRKMSEHQNAKYTINTIQNEVLQCLTDMLGTQVICDVKERGQFSIMAEETKVTKK